MEERLNCSYSICSSGSSVTCNCFSSHVLHSSNIFLCRLHPGVNGSVAPDGQLMPPPVSFIPVSTSRGGLQMSAALSSSCEDLTLCGVKPE